MIVGNSLPALVLANALKGTPHEIAPEQSIYIIQAGMFLFCNSYNDTIVSCFKIRCKITGDYGSFIFLHTYFITNRIKIWNAGCFGAEVVGGLVAIIVGMLIGKIRKFFPPIVSGTVVLTIGLSLYSVAIGYMAGEMAILCMEVFTTGGVAILTLVVVLICNMYGKGIIKLLQF